MRTGSIQVVIYVLVLLITSSSFAEVKFRPGANLRLRHEYLKDISDFDSDAKDNQNYFRIKYSLWGNLELNKDVSFFAKLTSESKAYTYWYQTSTGKKGYHYDINETVFDNLYLDVKNLFGAPIDVRLGRQDFPGTYGEGFLIMDGTPLDGSRTYYFNALKASWRANDKNTVDFVYINDPRDDTFLPIINENDPPKGLNTSAEEAYMVYLKNKDFKNLNLEPYFIHKREADEGARLQAKPGRINTPGVFAKYNLVPFILRSQGAFQTGNYGDSDRQAWGGYLFVDRPFEKAKWSPSLSTGYIYLSGDDPATATNEGWDPLFSRYPWMSELYYLTYNGESGTAYWTNLQMWRTELSFKPTKKTKAALRYNFLRANEIPTGTSFATDDGKNRGQLPQARFDYVFNDNIAAYILAEYFIPGNFYPKTADDAVFLRTELQVKF